MFNRNLLGIMVVFAVLGLVVGCGGSGSGTASSTDKNADGTTDGGTTLIGDGDNTGGLPGGYPDETGGTAAKIALSGMVFELGDSGLLTPVPGVSLEMSFLSGNVYYTSAKTTTVNNPSLYTDTGSDVAVSSGSGTTGSGTVGGGTTTTVEIVTEPIGATDSAGAFSAEVSAAVSGTIKITTADYTQADVTISLDADMTVYLLLQKTNENTVQLTATLAKSALHKASERRVPESGGDAWIIVNEWDLAKDIVLAVTPYKNLNVIPAVNNAQRGLKGKASPVSGGDVNFKDFTTGEKITLTESGFDGIVYPYASYGFPDYNLETIYQMIQSGSATLSLWYYAKESSYSDDLSWQEAGAATLTYDSSTQTYTFSSATGVYMAGFYPYVFAMDTYNMPEITITGTVNDPVGPLPDCLIMAGNSQAITNPDGQYSVTTGVPMEMNQILVTASKNGFTTESVIQVISQDINEYALDITLAIAGTAPSEPATGETVSISGTVTNYYDNLPVPDAEVTAWTDVTVVIGDVSASTKTQFKPGTTKNPAVLEKLTVSGTAPSRTISVDFLDGVYYTWDFKKQDESQWRVLQEGATSQYTSLQEIVIIDTIRGLILDGYSYYTGKYDLRVQAQHPDGILEEVTGFFTVSIDQAIYKTTTWTANDSTVTTKGGRDKGFYYAVPAEYDTYDYTEPMPMPMPEDTGTGGTADGSGGTSEPGQTGGGSTGADGSTTTVDASTDTGATEPSPGMYPVPDYPNYYGGESFYTVEWWIKASGTYAGTLTTIADKQITSAEYMYANQLNYFLADNFESFIAKFDSDNDGAPDKSYMEQGIDINIYAKLTYTLNGLPIETTIDVEENLIQEIPKEAVKLDALEISPFFAGPFSEEATTVLTDANGNYTINVNVYYDGYIKMQVTATDFFDGDVIELPVSTDGAITQDVVLFNYPFMAGQAESLAGLTDVTGSADGYGTAARFNAPEGIAGDGTYLYVCDTGNHVIRSVKIDSGKVETMAGTAGATGNTDGTGATALFNTPKGIVYAGGYCYITDTGNNAVRKLDVTTKEVTTVVSGLANLQKGIASDGTNYYVSAGQMLKKYAVSDNSLVAEQVICESSDTVNNLVWEDGKLFGIISGRLFVFDAELYRRYLGIDTLTGLTGDGNTHLISYAATKLKRFHTASMTTYESTTAVTAITNMFYNNGTIYGITGSHTITGETLAIDIISAEELAAAPYKTAVLPFLVGSYDTPGIVSEIYASTNYAYVTDGSGILQILDITNTTSPTITGSCFTSGIPTDVYINGIYAYITVTAAGMYGSSFQIIDITNQTIPTVVSLYSITGSPNKIYVNGNYAYLADETVSLQIIDITNPELLSLVGSYGTIQTNDIYVAGNYAYLVGNTGLQIIDISNQALPVLTGSYDTPGNAYGVYVNGNYAFVADTIGGLQIIDISNPALPTLTSFWTTPGYDVASQAQGVYVSGIYAYVADGSHGLQIIDISDPALPVLTGTYASTDAFGVYINGNYAYVSAGPGGLKIIGGIK
ncbi:MAG: hypothetical protein HZA48_05305 [Planctomycetes bacterium]|nr:hypothetical protein [Planctomycetota bacterium]